MSSLPGSLTNSTEKLPSTHSRNFLDCFHLTVFYFQQTSCKLKFPMRKRPSSFSHLLIEYFVSRSWLGCLVGLCTLILTRKHSTLLLQSLRSRQSEYSMTWRTTPLPLVSCLFLLKRDTLVACIILFVFLMAIMSQFACFTMASNFSCLLAVLCTLMH